MKQLRDYQIKNANDCTEILTKYGKYEKFKSNRTTQII